MYEGVEPGMGEGSVDGPHMTAKERSGSANLDHYMKKIKPENIEGIICEGFLKKLRKEGKIYVGSKWQKRYCVVRNHVLYYFKDKKAKEQAGQILLPGYKAQVANRKGREFSLTHSHLEIRAYQFEGTSKEETEKWIKAINAACDAPLSEDQTALLAELRNNKQPSGDEDSLHYDDTGQAKNEVADESNGDDAYDDTNEDLYEVVGIATQSAASNQQSQPPRQDVDYEISAAAVSSTPASAPAEPSPVEPIQEDYELPEQTSPAPPPPRPTKSQPQSPRENIPPDLPPPRPSKAQPASPAAPQQDELYEIADSPEVTSSELPQPPAPLREEENYEISGESPPQAPAPVRPPRIPQPPTPKPSPDVSQKETHEKIPERPARPGAKPQLPPPPQRKDEPPQSPSENQTNEINYANIYQALWNCDAGDKDELGFRRGDLIYIYEKPHPDWWIGSLFKPQGYSVGLVPKQYVMEAYELTAS
ncbi:src kinase-associated phosphoprotein 1-like [Orbicella faveolata]|uniref:src kinase-associated phosphoprotein 1-like n=1 Tax=Orbicella faveolata TaxID=48498 RepID=UPI0009E496D2|nr:src kinase-associated phosphoprotein 1-like [Orbicella faveolata]